MSKKEIKWQQCEAAWIDGTAVGENRKQLSYFYSPQHPQASRFHGYANGQLVAEMISHWGIQCNNNYFILIFSWCTGVLCN
jgi:hypothetical protein